MSQRSSPERSDGKRLDGKLVSLSTRRRPLASAAYPGPAMVGVVGFREDEVHTVARRFGIADALILIGGIGAGLGILRHIDSDITPASIWRVFFDPPQGWTLRYAAESVSELTVVLIIPFLAAWTLACFAIQCKTPRPRSIGRLPGFIGCLVPTAMVVLTVGVTWACLGVSRWDSLHPSVTHYESAQVIAAIVAGSGVLWAWITMLLCRAFRAQASWTDRLGRLTGLLWIIVALLSGAYLVLS